MVRFNKKILRKLSKDSLEDKITPNEKIATVTTERTQTVEAQTGGTTKTPSVKYWITSVTKYAYLIVIASLMAGIFTPWTIGVELGLVVQGILILLLGLAGGVLTFKAVKRQNPSKILSFVGLGLMVTSLILVYQISGRPLF